MENYKNDTIAAIATALSDSGIGIVRISGENAIYIVDSIFRSASGKKILTKVQSHMIHYGYIVDKDENIIDEVMTSVMKAPKSYTMEDTVEYVQTGYAGDVSPLVPTGRVFDAK